MGKKVQPIVINGFAMRRITIVTPTKGGVIWPKAGRRSPLVPKS